MSNFNVINLDGKNAGLLTPTDVSIQCITNCCNAEPCRLLLEARIHIQDRTSYKQQVNWAQRFVIPSRQIHK